MVDMPQIQELLKDEAEMKRLLDVRTEEEMGRLDGIPGVNPSEFKFYDEAADNRMVQHEYGNMLAIYVFKAEDRTPYDKAVEKVKQIHERLLQNKAWTNYKVSVLVKLESKKKEAAEQNKFVQNKDKSRSEEIE